MLQFLHKPVHGFGRDRLLRSLATPVANRLRQQARFTLAFVRAPRQTGSICPSSACLVAALAGFVPQTPVKNSDRSVAGAIEENAGIVIDLGSGTGIVTAALLARGIAADRVIAVESCQHLAQVIRRSYPGVDVFAQDARNLGDYLDTARQGACVGAIISSLPFRSLPKKVAGEIALEIRQIMEERGGVLVQYSYAWWKQFPLTEYGFVSRHRFIVFRNIPPAVVEVYDLPYKQ